MKLRAEQLNNYLLKNSAPFYWISGDELLLVQEACELIRKHVQQLGFTEIKRFSVDSHFNWEDIFSELQSYSLFSSKKLIEIRFPGKINASLGKMLQSLIENLSDETILLIISGKLESSTQNSQWYKALESQGVAVAIWPLDPSQMPRWITQRLQQVNITTTPEGIHFLVSQSEGNLLSTAQEIEKLSLLYGAGNLNTEKIIEAVSDNARFDIFKLTEAILHGESSRIPRILSSLCEDGTDPILILWALARELRQLIIIAYQLKQGKIIDSILQELRIWEKRKFLYKNSVKRHSLTQWQKKQQQASNIDCMIKGIKSGQIWNELLELAVSMAGAETRISACKNL